MNDMVRKELETRFSALGDDEKKLAASLLPDDILCDEMRMRLREREWFKRASKWIAEGGEANV